MQPGNSATLHSPLAPPPQIRHLLDLIQKMARSSSRPALPIKLPCCERFQRCREAPLRPGDVVPTESRDGHSRCGVAELRKGSRSKARVAVLIAITRAGWITRKPI